MFTWNDAWNHRRQHFLQADIPSLLAGKENRKILKIGFEKVWNFWIFWSFGKRILWIATLKAHAELSSCPLLCQTSSNSSFCSSWISKSWISWISWISLVSISWISKSYCWCWILKLPQSLNVLHRDGSMTRSPTGVGDEPTTEKRQRNLTFLFLLTFVGKQKPTMAQILPNSSKARFSLPTVCLRK